jgi:hypothetical protein
MEFGTLLIVRVLLSVVTLGYSLGTVKADFNKTHVTNPLWTGHGRFHVAWQITSYVGVGLIALALIWLPGSLPRERLYLAAALAAAIYLSFFITFAAMPAYGGRAYDDNGYLPFTLGGMKLDVNATVFSIMSLLLLTAIALLAVG